MEKEKLLQELKSIEGQIPVIITDNYLPINGTAKKVILLSAKIGSTRLDGEKYRRLLSIAEIADASVDMNVDFAAYALIPLFDLADNDYIVYDAKHEKWAIFNIVDEIIFNESDTLEVLL